MDYRFPEFYYEFKCKADKCEHTCCKGWEISIDLDTAEKYRHIPGKAGREVCSHLLFDTDGAEMILTEDERCPFLLENGLCRMICDYGEDYISDICAEHPRFYNTFLNVSEAGLGLSCEAVTDLLLAMEDDFEIITSIDESEVCTEPDYELELADKFRKTCDDYMYNFEGPAIYAASTLVKQFDELYELPSAKEIAKKYLTLEIMDTAWESHLREVIRHDPDVYISIESKDDVRYRNILRYFLYRNIPAGKSVKDCEEILKVMVSGMVLIAAMTTTGVELRAAVRLYSAEIEYSDCNIDLLKELLRFSNKRLRTG